jgi:hypothetical protein
LEVYGYPKRERRDGRTVANKPIMEKMVSNTHTFTSYPSSLYNSFV